MKKKQINKLKVKSLGIDTYRENIIFMRVDCEVCLSEGFSALTRVVVAYKRKTIIATLNVIHSKLLRHNEASLSLEAMKRLGVMDGDLIAITHLQPIHSLSKVRAKIYGKELNAIALNEIITDVVAGKYSNIELAAFITACSGNNLSVNEITGLTKAMIHTGNRLHWNKKIVLDKHSVGGLPGNRTTPIIVSVIAAAGLTIPKTSSHAITSPAGTADTMATMTKVDLSMRKMKMVVGKEGGCLAWGGAVKLSPADDILISVEKALDVDSEGQMIASVLSKKVSAGSTHVLIDIPVGPTAKVRSQEEALRLEYYFKAVGKEIGLTVEVSITDGSQPIGRGIGPVAESIDVLSVLRNEMSAPADLREKALMQAGMLLEISGRYKKGTGKQKAMYYLESGKALEKFMAICKAQGGFKEPKLAKHKYDVIAKKTGTVSLIDNRQLARIAKLAGAPKAPASGIILNVYLNKKIITGDLLFTIYAQANGVLEYSRKYLESIPEIIHIV